MKNYDNVPYELQPIGAWSYFGHSILYSIPLIGQIFLICHAIGSRNVNKRSFARSYFCVFILAAIIIGIMLIVSACIGAGANLFGAIKNFFESLFHTA